MTKAVTAFSSLSDFCPQDETVFRLLTNQPDCRIYRESADGAQTLALSATPQPQNRPLAPFLTDLVEYCRLGRFDDFLTFYQQVPLRFRTNLNALQLFWNFANRQDRLQLPQIAAALRIEELKSAAISQLLQTDRFTFQEQLSLYSALPKPEQDELVNRILREYSIQQIRQEPRLRDILLGALAIETGLKSDGDTLPAAQTPEDGKPTSPISPTFLPLRGLNGVVKRISSLFFPKPATNQQPAKKMNPEKRNPS